MGGHVFQITFSDDHIHVTHVAAGLHQLVAIFFKGDCTRTHILQLQELISFENVEADLDLTRL